MGNSTCTVPVPSIALAVEEDHKDHNLSNSRRNVRMWHLVGWRQRNAAVPLDPSKTTSFGRILVVVELDDTFEQASTLDICASHDGNGRIT